MAVLEKATMLSIAEKAVEEALRKGAQEVEAYVYEGQATNIGIELGQISKSNRIIDRGIGIRIAINKAIGFAYTNVIDDSKAIETAVASALSAAKASKPDPDWKGLPQKKSYAPTEKTFDKKILELSSEELVNVAATMLDAAGQADKRVFPIEGGVGGGYVSHAVANSNGVEGFDGGTMVECSLATLAKEGGSVTPVCFEFDASREYNLDPTWVGKEAARLAVTALKTKSVETKSAKVIFTQFALQDLLSYTLINAIKADSVQRNQSPFKGKIGEKVASENLTIFDDGLFVGGLRTSVFDGEGVPHQKTAVIERGILKNFIYDNYSAKKEDKESTGNAARAGYLSTPNIDTTNFHLMPGAKTTDEMLAEVDDGLIVYYLQGAHSSNPVSGEFSVVATPAWKIKDGKITHSSRGVMLAGNVFEVLKNISVIGGNERQMGSMIAPWVQVENVRVIGK
ncbi:MAG: TldD/PmbA family protein [Candidatus Bathyarchaeota archaeon]|nr:TldD/PmbA family protein [Candidatus Bathyarchaeota archaeon]